MVPRQVTTPSRLALKVLAWQKQAVRSLFGALRAGQSRHSRPSGEKDLLPVQRSHAVLPELGWLPAGQCAHDDSSAEREVPGSHGAQTVKASEFVLPAAQAMPRPIPCPYTPPTPPTQA